MKEEKLKEITQLFLEFHPIHQQKITSLFSKNTNDPYNCNRNQIKAIMIIGKHGEIIPTILGKCLGLQRGSLTTLLDSLEDMGLINKISHPKDRRKLLITLTDKGIEYRHLKAKQFEQELSHLFDNLTEEKLDEFIPCFKNVLDTMKEL